MAGLVSLLTLHIIWPFLWIWAMLYREDRGWGLSSDGLVSEARASASAATPPAIPEGPLCQIRQRTLRDGADRAGRLRDRGRGSGDA